MNLKIDKKLEESLKLADYGFQRMKFHKGNNKSNYKRQMNKNRIDVLSFFVFSSFKNKKGLFISFKPIVGVIFPVINEILEKAGIGKLIKNWDHINNDERDNGKWTCINHPDFNYYYSEKEEISNNLFFEKNFIENRIMEREAIKFRHIVEKDILPFYELFPNLQAVNDVIVNQFERKEVGKFIPGQIDFKQIIIMGLCRNIKYQNYTTKYEESLVKAIEQNPMYRSYLDFFYKLKETINENLENFKNV